MADFNDKMEFVEVEGEAFEESDFFQFQEIGQSLSGRLISSHQAKNPRNGKFQNVYNIKDKEGNRWALGETADLKTKLCKIPMGTFVRIEWTGEKDVRNGTMKIFSVKVPKGTKLEAPF